MIETQNIFNEVFIENSNQPDLLVLQEPNGSQVQSIFLQCNAECIFHFIDISFMQVQNFLFVVFINQSGGLLISNKI